MALINVQFGPGNSISRNYASTADVQADTAAYQFLGASPENTEVHVNGSPYSGDLFEGDVVSLVTKAHKKNKA